MDNHRVLDHRQAMALLPKRDENSHKGDFGRILLLCGSRGYTGAAYFAAMGALRCGAGLVYLGVPESIYEIEAVKLNEPVVIPLPDAGGKLSRDSIGQIRQLLPRMDAVLIGCGLGQSEDTFEVVRTVLTEAKCPAVVDADGINVLAGHKDIVRGRVSPTILTPHDGEFFRIAGAVGENRMASAEGLARDLGCILLLKGHRTCITDGEVSYMNTTGNSGMAVGGSGDVLAGMIVGLLGQGMMPLEAAALAAWLHGSAGDLCARELGEYSMLPSDMLAALPRLLK